MATYYPSSSSFSRAQVPLSPSLQYQRGKSKIKIKKAQRKAAFKIRRILLPLLLLGGIFYGVHKLYLWLISWPQLNVKDIRVTCRDAALARAIEEQLQQERLGNILLLDISELGKSIARHPYVKDARIRKSFPSAIRIELQKREPAAVLKKGGYCLIDKEGVVLEEIDSPEKVSLPLFLDAQNFDRDLSEKLASAWECLDRLPPAVRGRVESLDLSEVGHITLRLKGNFPQIILGENLLRDKWEAFEKDLARWESLWGPLEYVDLRIPGRTYVKIQQTKKAEIPGMAKEVE
jgi:cell division septal protein FtsQ